MHDLEAVHFANLRAAFFSDASEEAIGFVIYMRCIENDEVSVTFVAGGSQRCHKYS